MKGFANSETKVKTALFYIMQNTQQKNVILFIPTFDKPAGELPCGVQPAGGGGGGAALAAQEHSHQGRLGGQAQLAYSAFRLM